MKNRAVFLDRDGVIVEEVDYLRRPSQLKLIPGAAEAITRLHKAGFKTIVVSNQSGIARGYFTRGDLRRIHAKLRAELKKKGARVDAIYFCPHHPEAGERVVCDCRKPKIGMLLEAKKRFKIDLKKSFLVGDSSADMGAARSAGVFGILVRTGYGGKDGKHKAKPQARAKDLGAAADWILAR